MEPSTTTRHPLDLLHTSFGPPKTRHETWAPHAVNGWYIGPALDHYRCHMGYIPETKSEHITDTLVWCPKHVVMPTASSTERAIAAAHDLTQALLHPSPATTITPFSDSQLAALTQLASLFTYSANPPPRVDTPVVPPGLAPLPIPKVDDPAPTVHSTALSENSSTAAPSPRVDSYTATPEPPEVTYVSKTGNAGQRRRNKKKQDKRNQLPPPVTPIVPPAAPIAVPARQPINHHHGTRSKGPARTTRVNNNNNATHEANHLATAIGELFEAPTPAGIPNIHGSANSVVDPQTGASLEYTQLRKGPLDKGSSK
jgi:hypothetical protein